MQLVPLTIAGSGYTLSIAPEAEAKKAALLDASSTVSTVTDEASLELATLTLKALAEFRRLLEKSRKEIKDPVLKAGREIDAKAAEFGDATDAQEKRIADMIGRYGAEQEVKRRAAAAEAQKKIDEANRAAAELEKAKEEAAKPTGFAAAAAALNAQEEAAQKLQTAQAEAHRSVMAVAAPTQGVKAALDFEVTDVRELYAHAPQLVELSPKRRDILASLKHLQDMGLPVQLPGLRVIESFKVSTR